MALLTISNGEIFGEKTYENGKEKIQYRKHLKVMNENEKEIYYPIIEDNLESSKMAELEVGTKIDMASGSLVPLLFYADSENEPKVLGFRADYFFTDKELEQLDKDNTEEPEECQMYW